MNSVCSPEHCTSTPEVVCRCLQVTRGFIRFTLETVEVCSFRELCQETGAGTGCTVCHKQLKAMLEEHQRSEAAAA